MAVLKWVVHLYISSKDKTTKKQMQSKKTSNTKYEEVQYTQEATKEEHCMFALPGEATKRTTQTDEDQDSEEEDADEAEETKEASSVVDVSDNEASAIMREERCGDTNQEDEECEEDQEETEEDTACVHFYDDLKYSQRKDPLPSGRVEYGKDGEAKGS
jgi:hypothetical protein